jgi:hypothetical protein
MRCLMHLLFGALSVSTLLLVMILRPFGGRNRGACLALCAAHLALMLPLDA